MLETSVKFYKDKGRVFAVADCKETFTCYIRMSTEGISLFNGNCHINNCTLE